MKINKLIIAAIAAIVIPIVVFSLFAISILPLLMLFFYYGIPIAVGVYLLILAKRYVDAKVQESNASTNMNALKESMDRIEEKLDKIDKTLEKVSE